MTADPAPDDLTGRERRAMVEQQLVRRGIADERIMEAMLEVPRHEFVRPEDADVAHDDRPLPIGHGQTISQPFMVGYMLERLEVSPDHKVLEVGAGSGYQAAVLGRIAREVYAIEISAPLADRARQTVARLGYRNVHIITGDGGLGYPDAAPFDRIIVAAACPQIPQPLVAQLIDGGRLVAPVGSAGSQTCLVGVREGEQLRIVSTIGCVFVPLRGEFGWKR